MVMKSHEILITIDYNYVAVCAAVARRQPELGGRAEADPQDLLRPDAVRAPTGPHHQGPVILTKFQKIDV
jgi:hypothetical protein